MAESNSIAYEPAIGAGAVFPALMSLLCLTAAGVDRMLSCESSLIHVHGKTQAARAGTAFLSTS